MCGILRDTLTQTHTPDFYCCIEYIDKRYLACLLRCRTTDVLEERRVIKRIGCRTRSRLGQCSSQRECHHPFRPAVLVDVGRLPFVLLFPLKMAGVGIGRTPPPPKLDTMEGPSLVAEIADGPPWLDEPAGWPRGGSLSSCGRATASGIERLADLIGLSAALSKVYCDRSNSITCRPLDCPA